MSYGETLPGEAHFDEGRWLQDTMPELHKMDTLWAYCIRGAAWFHHLNHQQVNDPVLVHLLEMGLVNGHPPDNKFNFGNRYTAIATSQLLDHLLVLEKQVREEPSSISIRKLTRLIEGVIGTGGLATGQSYA